MFFIIWKPKDKFTSFSNLLFDKESDALDWGKRNKFKKIEWKIVPDTEENFNLYWYK